MSQLLILFFVIFLALVTLCNAYPSSESNDEDLKMSQERNLIDALNSLLKADPQPTVHRSHRHCGGKAIKKLLDICPEKCTRRDDLLLHDMCHARLPDEDVRARCCP